MSFVEPPPRIDAPEPPPVLPPTMGQKARKQAPWFVTAFLFIAAKLKTLATVGLAALKFLKLGKVLITGGSMLASMWFYALFFGWKFAIGFVLCIFVHEMGHVFVAWRQGKPITAPLFIPGMGAIIFSKRENQSVWHQAIMGIGGPIGGTIAGLVCLGLYFLTNNLLFMALAYVAFFMNLFNLMPVVPLDGGWITGAISPYIWLFGLIGLCVMFFTGFLRNPMVLIIVLMSLPRLWQGLRGRYNMGNGPQPTLPQRIQMSVYYLGLAGFLFYMMHVTDLRQFMRKPQPPVAAHFSTSRMTG